MLGFLATAAAAHVAPNVLMKAVKSTHAGHRALAGTFSAGVDMGRQGQKLQHNLKGFLEYGVGPESLVEYHLGRKLGQKLQSMPVEHQDAFLDNLKSSIKNQVQQLPPHKREELQKTPILNTISMFAHDEGENVVKRGMMKFTVPESSKMTVKNHAINAGIVGAASVATHGHALFQPAISATRKFVSESKVGKTFMKNGLEKGLDGKVPSKATQLMWDMAVSPAALDPVRIGKALGGNVPMAARILKSNDPYQEISKIFNQFNGL